MAIQGTSAHYFLVALLSVPLITFIATYSISLAVGSMKYPMFFLSTSIEAKPASCIGTFGLSFTALCSPLVAFIRKNYIADQIEAEYGESAENEEKKKTAIRVNEKALKMAILAGFGGHGVASFQSVVDDCGGTYGIVISHLIFATVFFGCGSFYSYFSHRLDLLLPKVGTQRERFLRKLFCWGTFFQFCTVCVVFPTIILIWGGGRPFLTFVIALLEVSMLCTFMSTYITFYGEMKHLHFQLLIMNKDQRYSLSQRDHSMQIECGGNTGLQKSTIV